MLNYVFIFSLFIGCNGVGSGESVKIVKLTTSLTYLPNATARGAPAWATIEDVPDGVIDYTCYCVTHSKNAENNVDENGYYYDNSIGDRAGETDVKRNKNTNKLSFTFRCGDYRMDGVETTPTCIFQY